ncbi:MAG: hypothetical protein E7208_10550 [Clostridium butyricum]|nr:hypothetical protein [Clostridium butyricum]
MDTVLEQFIASDRPKRTSKVFNYLAIIFASAGVLVFMSSNIIGIALEIAAAALFIGSYFMYIDYEYELFEGNITVSKIYKASKRKLAQKIDRDEVRKVYVVERKDALKKGVQAYYNTNLEGLKIYTFELKNQKKVQLALNEKFSEMVDIYYKQKFTF